MSEDQAPWWWFAKTRHDAKLASWTVDSSSLYNSVKGEDHLKFFSMVTTVLSLIGTLEATDRSRVQLFPEGDVYCDVNRRRKHVWQVALKPGSVER